MTHHLHANYEINNEAQLNILDRLETAFATSDQPKTLRQRILAVTGERGWGKSTLLYILREKLVQETQNFVIPLIDASLISEEIGVFGECFEKMHRHCIHVLKSRNEKGSFKKLEEKFEVLRQEVIRQQTPSKEIAKEMAMSPDHYINLMLEWNNTPESVSEKLNDYLTCLRDFLSCSTKSPLIVIMLDDLDLAHSATILRWVKGMIGWYRKCATDNIYWVLTYEKQRMIRALSPSSQKKARESGYDKLDTVCGHSLLTKLVSSQRQFLLRPWNTGEGAAFRPFKDGLAWGDKSLQKYPTLKEVTSFEKLLQEKGLINFKTALPHSPRALNSFYWWLREDKTGSPLFALEKIAEINGSLPQFKELCKREVLTLFQLPKSFAYWSGRLIHAIRHNKPLPLETQSFDLEEASLFVEQLFEQEVAQQELTIHHVLSITQHLDAFALAEASFPFRQPTTLARFFDKDSKLLGAGLFWSKWEKEVVSQSWCLKTGPKVFWESLFLGDHHRVAIMLSELYINRPELGLELDNQFSAAGNQIDILPRNFRALLLMVFQLSRAPWLELAVSHQFWTPISVIRCSAAFYVSAMACEIWPELELASELYWPRHPFSKVKLLNDTKVHEAFKLLITDLKAKSFDLEIHDPLQLAQKAMHNALTNLFQLKALTLLAEELT